MSTRVQKGSQKFKPIAKPRARPSENLSRQTSTAPEVIQDSQPVLLAASLAQKPFRVTPSTFHEHSHEYDETTSTVGSAPHAINGSTSLDLGSENALGELENVTWTAPLMQASSGHTDAHSSMPESSQGPSRAIPFVIPSFADRITLKQTSFSSGEATRLDVISSSETAHESSQQVPESTLVNKPNTSEAQQIDYHEHSNSTLAEQFDSLQSIFSLVFVPSEPETSSARIVRDIEERKRERRSPVSNEASRDLTDDNQHRQRASSNCSRSEGSIGGPSMDVQYDITSMEENNGESQSTRRKKRRRSSNAASTVRRSRTTPITPFDPDADPGEDLDPTAVTMAAICADTGQGRVSRKALVIQKNHLAWKAANKEKRARMRAVMEAKKYGRNGDETNSAPEATGLPMAEHEGNIEQVVESEGDAATQDASGSGFNYAESMSTNRFNVQVRIGPNGETIIDEESLFVDRAENAEDPTDQYTHVEESDQTKFVNSASYTKKVRSSRWSAEETELFFDALAQFGENYELISYILPGRDRKACKNKFKAEDKKNPNRINYCLTHRVPYDIQTLSRMTGKDFSGPTPEIRVPNIPILSENNEDGAVVDQTAEHTIKSIKRKSATPHLPESGIEVLGDIESFDLGGDADD